MKTRKHSLLLNRTFQYFGIILVMAAIGGGYWYWKNAQAGVHPNASQEGTLSNGLVGYWPFDGNDISGTTAYDRSGNANNGTISGSTATPSIVGQALSFNGTSDYVSISDSAPLSPTAQMSVSVWVNRTENVYLNDRDIISKSQSGSRSWGTNARADGGFNFYVANALTDTGSNYASTGANIIQQGAWTHLMFVFNGSGSGNADRAKIYVNGIQQTLTFTGTINSSLQDSSGPVVIGDNEYGGYHRMKGYVDEPRIYNRALSASEIWDLYQMGNPDKVNTADSQGDTLEKGVIGYWKFDEGSGTTTTDSSGNSKTGTLANGPTWSTGKMGGAVNLDGTDDVVTLPAVESGTRQGTISAWVKPSFTLSSADYRKITYSDLNGSCDHVVLEFDTFGNKWGFNAKGGCVGPAEIYSSAVTSNTDLQQWHHIVGTWDGLNGIERLYVDGAKVNEVSSSAFTIGNVSYVLGGGGWKTWQGDLDEFRVYNRALSADEVAKLYKQTAPDNPDTGLVGYWPFNGPDVSGTTAYDRSGNANNGTLTNGPTVIPGRSGQAINFDGNNDYVSVPDANPIDFAYNQDFSIGFWSKFPNSQSSTSSTTNSVIEKNNGSGRYPYAFRIYNQTAGGNAHRILFGRSDGTNSPSMVSNRTVNDNEWHYIVSTKSGSTLSMYIDGIFEKTGTDTTTTVTDNASPLYIGMMNGTLPLTGYVDEPRIYNRALSASEIWDLYQMGNPDHVNSADSQGDPLEKGLVGYWKLDDGSGTSATDSSGNANTGTLTNGPTWTTGQIGGATSFDGTDDYINVGNQSALNLGINNFSISVWIFDTGATQNTLAINKRNALNTAGYELLDSVTPGTHSFRVGDGTVNVAGYSVTGLNNGSWHLLTGVVDRNSQKLITYLDGFHIGTDVSITGMSSVDNTQAFQIGARGGATNFKGSLDEVRIYNRALSADEVAKLYKTTAPDNPDTGLVGYWSFNGSDVSGTTAYDRSGKGNNGTLTNGPSVTPGKAGQGLRFDGSDDRINYGNISALKPSFPFTVMAWVKGTGGAAFSNGKGDYFCSPATPYADNYSGIVFYMNGGVAGGNGGGQSASNRFERVASVSAADGQWHHIAAVLQAGNNISLYKDGSLNNGAYDDGTSTTIAYDTRPVLVGAAYECGYLYHANGTVDEVRIYNRALSAAEITAIYNTGR